MNRPVKTECVQVGGEELILHPLKFIYWPAQQTLLCADLHIGKGEHFRKNGITVPKLVNKNNFWNLSGVFALFNPKRLIVLGDMVHSTHNNEWNDFTDFLDNYPNLLRTLVRGNHELYLDEVYHRMEFEVFDILQISKLILTHEPLEEIPPGFYNLCGHIHPAVRLVAGGRQSIRAACFCFGSVRGVLPACGEFTGTALIHPRAGDQLFVIADNVLIKKELRISAP